MLGFAGLNVVLVVVVAGVPVLVAVPPGEVGGVVMTWGFFFSSAL